MPSSFGEDVHTAFLRTFSSFRRLVHLSNIAQRLSPRRASSVHAPRVPYRILPTEQFVKGVEMLQELKLLRQTPSLRRTHTKGKNESMSRGETWSNCSLPLSSRFPDITVVFLTFYVWQLDLLPRTQSLNEILTLILVSACDSWPCAYWLTVTVRHQTITERKGFWPLFKSLNGAGTKYQTEMIVQ